MDGLDIIRRNFERRLQEVPTAFHRYLYRDIDWRDRLVGIKGPKGSGKSTLVLQHIKETFDDPDKVLYVSLDDLWFASHPLDELIEHHYTHGGTHVFFDEIHYHGPWQTMLKNIHDNYPRLHVAYTGSSMLRLDGAKGDLSRRLMEYTLRGLSFREYLAFEGLKDIPAVSLEELLARHTAIAREILSDGFRVLPAFEKYLESGYYPFYKDIHAGFGLRLQQVVNQVLENDFAVIERVEHSTIRKAKKMFMILGEQVPQVPTMSHLYRELGTDRNQGLKMLYALERAGLLALLPARSRSLDDLSRPEKIFLDNTNLMYALALEPNAGTLRETFFFNQLSQGHHVTYPPKGDFLVDGKYLFEVGGAKKSFEQVRDMPDSFLALDGIEIGRGDRIPLWMFGLLY